MADFEGALSGLGEGISQVGTAGMEARLAEERAQIEANKAILLDQYKRGMESGERKRIGGLLSQARRPDGSIDRSRAQELMMESGDIGLLKEFNAADYSASGAEYNRGAREFAAMAGGAARLKGEGGFGGQKDMEKLTDALKDYAPKDPVTGDSMRTSPKVMAAVEKQARYNVMVGMGEKEAANKAWLEFSGVLAQTGDENAAAQSMKDNMKARLEKMRRQPQPAKTQPPPGPSMAQPQDDESRQEPPQPAPARNPAAQSTGRPRGLLQFGQGATIRPDGTLYVGDDKTGPRWKK